MHETEALHIRRLTAEDLEPLHRLLSDPAVMRYLEPPFTRAQKQTRNWSPAMCSSGAQ